MTPLLPPIDNTVNFTKPSNIRRHLRPFFLFEKLVKRRISEATIVAVELRILPELSIAELMENPHYDTPIRLCGRLVQADH